MSCLRLRRNLKDAATRVRELTKLVSKVKMSNSVVTLRLVCLEEVVVLTTFDAFSGQERKKGSSQGSFLITIRGVKKKDQHLYHDRVQQHCHPQGDGSAHLAQVDRQLYVWPLVEALLKGEPPGGSVWLEVLGIMVTDATSPFDHLQTTGSIPVERPNHAGRHLAPEMPMTEERKSFPVKNALHQTTKEAEQEEHRKHFRQQPRHRRKERNACFQSSVFLPR